MRKVRPPGVEEFSPELYDTSEIEFEMPPNKKRNRVTLIAEDKSGADFNLVKYVLALREFVENIERELNIMSDTDGDPQ